MLRASSASLGSLHTGRHRQPLPLSAPLRAAARCGRSRRYAASAAASASVPQSLGLRDATLRARESLREDKLFDDPWAAIILGEAVHAILPVAPGETAHAAGAAFGRGADSPSADETDAAAVSVRVLDAALLNAVAGPDDEAPRQVVLIGHGCDTRPFRIEWPKSTRLFEIGAFDSIAHAEIAFQKVGVKHPEGCILRRLAADVSGPQATGSGWLPSLEAAGYMADRSSAWGIQGGHLLSQKALDNLLVEIGDGASLGSVLVGEVSADLEASVGGALARSGFTLLAWEPLGVVAERLGRPLDAISPQARRGFFLARKARLSLKQEFDMRDEIQRAEEEGGEEGFSDAP